MQGLNLLLYLTACLPEGPELTAISTGLFTCRAWAYCYIYRLVYPKCLNLLLYYRLVYLQGLNLLLYLTACLPAGPELTAIPTGLFTRNAWTYCYIYRLVYLQGLNLLLYLTVCLPAGPERIAKLQTCLSTGPGIYWYSYLCRIVNYWVWNWC